MAHFDRLILKLFVICFFTSLASEPAKAADEIILGLLGPMTGQLGLLGTQLKQGAQAAVDDINSSGGLFGRKIRLVVADDQCFPAKVKDATT